ncbi:MAG: hypothetical protein IID40_08325 [Planctomycetes bacterium]|nr:hypothetical protein [Planctomycetota bacterium]
MTGIQRNIQAAQVRLWANFWFDRTCWALTAAAGAMAAVVLFDRLYGMAWPVGWVAAILGGAAVAVATVWSYLARSGPDAAAVALDEAAGLRERISTGLYCRQEPSCQDDPFAQAVLADAERLSRSLSVRQHLRLRAPFSAVYAGLAVLAAALLLLLPSGLLVGDKPGQWAAETAAVKRTKVVVQRRLDEIKKLAEVNPALKDLKEALEKLDQAPTANLKSPEQVRHEAIKKIDRLSDALREQRRDNRFNQVDQVKKMLRGIKRPGQTHSTAQKLTQALAKGDFKAAQEHIKAMQEKLATLKPPQDTAKMKEMQKQLAQLAKKIADASQNKQLRQKLEQAGLKKEDIERMLKNLSKKDLEQLKKQLQKQGLSQKQIDKLAQQLQKQQQASAMATRMSQAFQQAADAAGQSQMGQAMQGLESAGEQLSEMEMLEQEMNQMDSALADLQDAKNDLDNPCSSCNGTGDVGGKQCGSCQGTGQGQGRGRGMGPRPGRGKGGLAQEQQTGIGFKITRGKVQTTKGRIIGQFLIDGQQIKGDVSAELAETLAAEERVATDLIYHDRIPRQYQEPVKKYFSSIQRTLERASTRATGSGAASSEQDGDENSSTEQTESDASSATGEKDQND